MSQLIHNPFAQNTTAVAKAIRAGSAVSNNAGGRIWPSKANDATVMIRFDWGEAHKQDTQTGKYWRWLNVQVNKEASNSTIANLAKAKDSHIKRASIAVETDASGQVVLTEAQLASALKTNFVDEGASKGI